MLNKITRLDGFCFKDRRFVFSTDIEVYISLREHVFSARCPCLDLDGTGNTETEALEAIGAQIVALYDSLSEDQEELPRSLDKAEEFIKKHMTCEERKIDYEDVSILISLFSFIVLVLIAATK